MTEKKFQAIMSKLLEDIEGEIKSLNSKIEDLLVPKDCYVEIESEGMILITEEVYLEICSEIGEDCLRFMGVS